MFFVLTAIATVQTAHAQTTAPTDAPAPPPAKRPGPGDPLPPFLITPGSKGATAILEQRPDPVTGVLTNFFRYEGGVTLTWGDVALSTERLFYRPTPTAGFYAEASGGITVRRGDELLRGDTFLFDSVEGLYLAQNASLSSPPLYIQGRTISRTADEIRATDARIGIGPAGDGRGELQFRVGEATVRDRPEGGQQLYFKNTSFYMLGTRVFTLRRVGVRLRSRRQRQRSYAQSLVETGNIPPIRTRVSRISGSLLGVSAPIDFGGGLTALADVDLSTRQGIQYGATIRQELPLPGSYGSSRRATDKITPGGIDSSVAGLSPLRQLLKARPLPPAHDAVLDYDSILSMRDPLSNPTRGIGRGAFVALTGSGPREYGLRRQGLLLLAREPEALAAVTLPFGNGRIPDNNDAARDVLRRPRWYAALHGSAGRFDETRLEDGGRRHIASSRVGGDLTFGLQPLLIGNRLLTRAETVFYNYTYNDKRHYNYLETTLSSSYVFAYRTTLGASYINRNVGGATPFFWDQVDTQNEAQAYGQLAFGRHRKYTAALLGRYDTAQHRLFDYEIAFASHGRNIEPRLYYRHLNGQIGINVTLPDIDF